MDRTRTCTLVVALTLLMALALGGTAHAADPVVAAVGDMACAPDNGNYNGGAGAENHCRQRYVSDLVVDPPADAFLALGDNQYEAGELANFQQAYEPSFGRANSIVYPSLGNAEYDTPGARGYFDYFSGNGVFDRIRATGGGDVSQMEAGGYYSFNIGSWHLIALNSNCDLVGGCWDGSPQEEWLKRDLAANPNTCTLAYWHHPRFNSGRLGNDSDTAAFWNALYGAGADVVLAGHGNHHYERHAPQSPTGLPDGNGIREFIVSTGGEDHGIPPIAAGNAATLEASDYTSFGILKLTLRPGSYDWQFVPEVGGSFTDSGTGTCHAGTIRVPSAPALTAVPTDGAVNLSWTPSSNGGAAISGYKIYRGTAAGSESLLASVGNVTSYEDLAVTNGTKYYYRVAAVNGAGEGARSNTASGTPTPPPPPVAFPTSGQLDDFARASGPLGANWQSPGLQDNGTVTIDTSGITKSSEGAATATWNGGTFGADQEAYLTLPTLPAAGGFVQVAGRVSTQSRTGISCYFVRLTPSTGTWDLRKKIDGGASTSLKTLDAPFSAGDSLGLRLRGQRISAYRKPGNGAWTEVGSAVDTAISGRGYASFTLGDTTARGGAFGGGEFASPPPPPPPSVSASDATGAEGNSGQADLTFTVSLSEAATSPATVDYRTQDGTATSAGLDYAPAAGTLTFSPGQISKTVAVEVNGDTAFEPAETFTLELFNPAEATIADGTGLGTIENDDTAPDLTPPAAPAGLIAIAGDRQVSLDWADNAEPDLDHYDVFRSTVPGGPYAKLNSTALTTSAYTNTGLVNGSLYYYVLRAFDRAGNGSLSSVQVSARPVAPPAPIVFEGEVMTRSPSSNSAIRVSSEKTASAGKTLEFRTSPSTGTKAFVTTRPADQITLRMRGDSCNGAPVATVTVDSFPAGTVTVSAAAHTDYVLPLTATSGGAAGAHTLKVTYANDLKTKTCDRSLYLDKVTIRQV